MIIGARSIPIVSAFVATALMALSALFASLLMPTKSLAVNATQFELDKLIPLHFAGWSLDRNVALPVVNPQAQAVIDSIYEQTLSVTYVNDKGVRMMLSIAYGVTQSDSLKAHTPEICYPAQGFVISAKKRAEISTNYGVVPVTRLVTTLGNRHEPVTYWIIVGDRVGSTNLERKLIQLDYGFSGFIPDGLLVRVSSVDSNARRAFQMQERFLRDMFSALDGPARKRLAGLG